MLLDARDRGRSATLPALRPWLAPSCPYSYRGQHPSPTLAPCPDPVHLPPCRAALSSPHPVPPTRSGQATTLRRNGSDFSATILGALFRSGAITIWTDVDGVYSADPRKVRGC
jgi:hypothetical protein